MLRITPGQLNELGDMSFRLDFTDASSGHFVARAARALPSFVRGDCNDDGAGDIADAITLLNFLFGDGNTSTCRDACDGNDDGGLDIADAVTMLEFLFGDPDPPLPDPFPECGVDVTADSLICEGFDHCP